MARTIPIIKLYNNLLVSIQVDLSDGLVAELKEELTSEIQATNARGLIIELSGIDVLDSYIARSIGDISSIARLMGTKTVIAGLDPTMAHSLVEMGMTLEGLETALNLESAIESLAAGESEIAGLEMDEDFLLGLSH